MIWWTGLAPWKFEPYTLHTAPYTLHPTPFTLHPTPYTLHPTPCTPYHTPYNLHPTPYTPNNCGSAGAGQPLRAHHSSLSLHSLSHPHAAASASIRIPLEPLRGCQSVLYYRGSIPEGQSAGSLRWSSGSRQAGRQWTHTTPYTPNNCVN